MAKPKIPNQKGKYDSLNKRLADYVALVRQIYDVLNLEAAKMAESVGYNDNGDVFSFRNYPQLKDRLAKLQSRFVSDISGVIYSGTSREWRESNLIQDLVADKVLKTYGIHFKSGRYKKYYQTNSDALKAFQERKDRGMNLSQKIWNQSENYKQELEYAISSAIQKGMSAVTLSKRVSKYLQDFKSLQKDYKEKFGKSVDCHDCEYRSIRLARSEINLAYRTAEQKRWEQFDFVVGQEIKLSNNHTCNGLPFTDICDDLKGKYPKDFKFTGWHPMCRCYVIPILKTEDEFLADEDLHSKNEIQDTPTQFNDWVRNNKERINKAKEKGTLPYFVRDNIDIIEKIGIDSNKKIVYLPSDPIDVRKWKENAIEIENKIGVETGNQMSFEEANELRGNVNYENGVQYRVNCQSCVVANELRRRGYNVTAHGNYQNGDIPSQLSRKTNWAWIDLNTGQMPERKRAGGWYLKGSITKTKTYNQMMKEFQEFTKEIGRYHISWTWKGRSSGHIITMERLKDGKVVIYDPQNGKIISDFSAYAKNFSLKWGIRVLRVDDKIVNTEIIDKVVRKLD